MTAPTHELAERLRTDARLSCCFCYREPCDCEMGVCRECGPSPLDAWDVVGVNVQMGLEDDVDDNDGVTRGFCPLCGELVPIGHAAGEGKEKQGVLFA